MSGTLYQPTVDAVAIGIQARKPILVIGEPGIGKTATMAAIARQLDLHIETVIASIREPSDFSGLPVINNGGVTFAPPTWAKTLADMGKGIVFYDELSCAPPSIQAGVLRAIHEGVVGDLTLPQGVSSVACMNPPHQAAGGVDLAAPLANRFCHLEWKMPVENWTTGMVTGWKEVRVPILPADWSKHIPQSRALVATFIGKRPTALLRVPDNDSDAGKAWPSPRTWDMLATLHAACVSIHYDHPDNDTQWLFAAGCVGTGEAREFLNWIKELDLPDPEELLKNPKLFKRTTRDDRTFAVLNSVVSAILSNNTETRWNQGWQVISEVVDQGAPDIAVTASKALASNKPDPNAKLPSDLMTKKIMPILRQAGMLGQ